MKEAERLKALFEENKRTLKAMREREIRNFRKDLEFQKRRELERLEEEYRSKLTAEIIAVKVQLVEEIKEAIARSVESFLKERLTRGESERLVDLFVEELWSGGERIEKR
jgi:exonuclease VII large subunit